jgi:nickel transport protein
MARALSAFTVLLLLTPALPVAAHGLFWAPVDGRMILMTGHAPGTGHGDDDAEPLGAEHVARLLVADSDGVWRSRSVPPRGAVTTAPVAALLVVVDWGWWTKSADGTVNRPPEQVRGALQSWRSVESFLLLRAATAGFQAPLGAGLEITPEEDPFTLPRGRKLTLVVTLDGHPLADVPVAHDDKVRGRTDQAGRIRLKLRHGGRHAFTATLREPLPELTHAEDVRSARLVFFLEDE